MCKTYPIFKNNEVIGSAVVYCRSLYYEIDCKCELDVEGLHRITVMCHGKSTDLGICVPTGDKFGLHTKVAIKQIGEDELYFYITPKKQPSDSEFIPVCEDTEFLYLSRLDHAAVDTQNGLIGVRIQIDSSRPTGQ